MSNKNRALKYTKGTNYKQETAVLISNQNQVLT